MFPGEGVCGFLAEATKEPFWVRPRSDSKIGQVRGMFLHRQGRNWVWEEKGRGKKGMESLRMLPRVEG